MVAKSATRSATGMGGQDALGTLTVTDGTDTTDFEWTPFGGSQGCFTYYKVVYSETDDSPSYLTGANLAAVGSEQSYGSATAPVASGTYWFRVQVLRETALGKFVVAETDVVQHLVP